MSSFAGLSVPPQGIKNAVFLGTGFGAALPEIAVLMILMMRGGTPPKNGYTRLKSLGVGDVSGLSSGLDFTPGSDPLRNGPGEETEVRRCRVGGTRVQS